MKCTFQPESDHGTRLIYIQEMLLELAHLAHSDEHEFLAYLIDMARQETTALIRLGEKEGPMH